MGDLATVRWIVNSEYSGQPQYWTRNHYCAGWSEHTLCGIAIPAYREGIVEPDYGCDMDVPCKRCLAIVEKMEREQAVQQKQTLVDEIVADFKQSGKVNPAEIVEVDRNLTQPAIIASIKRLGGQRIGTTNWYKF